MVAAHDLTRRRTHDVDPVLISVGDAHQSIREEGHERAPAAEGRSKSVDSTVARAAVHTPLNLGEGIKVRNWQSMDGSVGRESENLGPRRGQRLGSRVEVPDHTRHPQESGPVEVFAPRKECVTDREEPGHHARPANGPRLPPGGFEEDHPPPTPVVRGDSVAVPSHCAEGAELARPASRPPDGPRVPAGGIEHHNLLGTRVRDVDSPAIIRQHGTHPGELELMTVDQQSSLEPHLARKGHAE